jgi:hypothetical protein
MPEVAGEVDQHNRRVVFAKTRDDTRRGVAAPVVDEKQFVRFAHPLHHAG